MNKTVITTALLTILGTPTYAANTPPAASPAESPTPTTVTTSASTPSALPSPPTVDCNYHLPAGTATVEQTLLSTWAQKAAVQAFDFNPATIDSQLAVLKACFTDQGWQSFNDALQKSGNINAIKSQHLTVSSQADGETKVSAVKDNQWKVTVPLQVVYQNEKEKLTQLLSIDLLIGRKTSGDLGVMQIIATPRQKQASVAVEKPGE